MKSDAERMHVEGDEAKPRAIERDNAAIAQHPSDVRAYAERSAANATLLRWKESLADADSALALDPESENDFLLKANAHAALEEWQQAAEAYSRCLEINPTQASALRGVGSAVISKWRQFSQQSGLRHETHETVLAKYEELQANASVMSDEAKVQLYADALNAIVEMLFTEADNDQVVRSPIGVLMKLGQLLLDIDRAREGLHCMLAACALVASDEHDDPLAKETLQRLVEVYQSTAHAHVNAAIAGKGRFYVDKALRYVRLLDDSESLARVLRISGVIHSEEGHYEDAADDLKAAIDVREKKGLKPSAILYSDMAETLFVLGMLHEALQLSDKATALARENDEKKKLARFLSRASDIHAALLKSSEAERCLRESLELDASPYNAMLFHSRMGALRTDELRDTSEVSPRYAALVRDIIEHYRTALELAIALNYEYEQQQICANLGRLLFTNAGDVLAVNEEAERLLRIAIRLGRKLKFIDHRMAFALTVYALYLICVEKTAAAEGSPISLLLEAERVVDSARRNLRRDDFHVVYADRREISILFDALVLAHLQDGDPGRALEAQERARSRALLMHLSTTMNEKSMVQPMCQPLSVKEMQSIALSMQAVFVFYNATLASGTGRMYAWVVEAGERPHFVELPCFTNAYPEQSSDRACDESDDSEVKRKFAFDLRSWTRSRDANVFYLSAKEEINISDEEMSKKYALLWKPIDSFIPKNGRVVVFPQGPLWKIPFSALLDENKRRLIEKHPVTLAPSVAVLSLIHNRLSTVSEPVGRGDVEHALVVGNPATIRTQFANLAGAEREACDVATLLATGATVGCVRTLVGTEATKATVLGEIDKFQIVHFATHGFVRGKDQRGYLPGGLVLAAGASRKEDDGMLLAEEVQHLDLSRLKLVFLSCCHTGSGDIKQDGLLGLGRAFLFAGCQCVVMAQWSLPDDETRLLVLEFYQEYLVKRDPASALRTAQLSRLKAGSSVRSWGGFCVFGDSSPLN